MGTLSGMDSGALLEHLRRELNTFEALLAGDLGVPIEHCGDWTLHDLAAHLGRSNRWASVAVTEQRGDYQAPPAPRDQTDLAIWFKDASEGLLTALERDPATPAWTFFPPHTVGFWRRRRCLEALIHRWDAENALGLPSGFDPGLAGEGIAEIIDTMLPRQIERGRTTGPAHAIRLAATDTGTSWLLGPGEPIATIDATAENLLLLLWKRTTVDDRFTWTGDRATAQAVLDSPLAP
jgi:uncharacterized protein (TIGR03083 family)